MTLLNVAAAARIRGKGYFEYLTELADARARYGDDAADFEVALTLATREIESAEKGK